jgi:hypothetical protein
METREISTAVSESDGWRLLASLCPVDAVFCTQPTKNDKNSPPKPSLSLGNNSEDGIGEEE